MNSLFARVATAIAVAASLAGCTSTGTVVPTTLHSQAMFPKSSGVRSNAQTSPCDIRKLWYLHGSCATFSMQPTGTTIALGAYRGLTVKMIWPADEPPQSNNTFILGDAVDKNDITGTYKGTIFPRYGSVKCVDVIFHPISCQGRAFLYNIFYNASSFEIGWQTTPKIRITNSRSYPGATCQVNVLQFLYGKPVWRQMPIHPATPVGNTVTFKPAATPFSLNTSSWIMFGFICS